MQLPALALLCLLVVATVAHGTDKRIVGGKNAEQYSHPYIVSLQFLYGGRWDHICGGVIVSERWVLTSADCVKTYNPQKLTLGVVLGAIKLDDPFTCRIKVSERILHPDFRQEDQNNVMLNNDIALLKLARPITKSNDVGIAKLASADDHFTWTQCVISGYGWVRMSNGSSDNPPHLREVNITKISNTVCNYLHPQNVYINDNQICAFDRFHSTGACLKDEGGPMMCGENHDILAGVVSYSLYDRDSRSCYGNMPVVSARVSRYVDWINSVISES